MQLTNRFASIRLLRNCESNWSTSKIISWKVDLERSFIDFGIYRRLDKEDETKNKLTTVNYCGKRRSKKYKIAHESNHYLKH